MSWSIEPTADAAESETELHLIMVVDDVEENRNLIRRRLARHQFKVCEASSGRQALDIVAQQDISVILLDVNMPDLNGFAVLKQLKQIYGERCPAVIMLTGVDEPEYVSEALELGANDFITKPFQFSVLEARIKTQIRESATKRALQNRANDLAQDVKSLEAKRELDSLTGVNSRKTFETYLARALVRSRSHSLQHALLFIGMDGFGAVNDAFGRSAGDRLLREMAYVLNQNLREGDVLGRIDGDCFAILLSDCDLEDAEDLAFSLLDSITNYKHEWIETNIRLSASIGLVSVKGDDRSVRDLFHFAEDACRLAKERGRNQFAIGVKEHNRTSTRKSSGTWAVKLRNALQENSLALYVQPIADAQDLEGPRSRFEVLVRMIDGDNVIAPGAFLEAAVEHGLAVELDRWVFNHTIEYLSSLSPEATDQLNRISINLAGQSLSSASMRSYLQDELIYNVKFREKICFEITETAAVVNYEQVVPFILRLQELGVAFALDDFGCGVNSFSTLKSLPVDYVKIDGQFVKNIDSSPVDRLIVRSINEVAQIMGKETIAEFVGSEEAIAELKAIGVNFLQGYYLGKPAPISNFL